MTAREPFFIASSPDNNPSGSEEIKELYLSRFILERSLNSTKRSLELDGNRFHVACVCVATVRTANGGTKDIAYNLSDSAYDPRSWENAKLVWRGKNADIISVKIEPVECDANRHAIAANKALKSGQTAEQVKKMLKRHEL